MKLKEVLAREKTNRDRINLYLEGSFWKAYEQSAYNFTKHIKAYQVKKRHIKYLGEQIVSMGFPNSCVEEIKKGQEILALTEKRLELKVREPVSSESFKYWKDGLDTATYPGVKNPKTEEETTDAVVTLLREFCLEHKTPMQCMLFVSELKKLVLPKSQTNAL